MAMRDLRQKYHVNGKGRQAINAAIRAEIAGGTEALDALELFHKITLRVGDGVKMTIAQLAHDRLSGIVNAMDDEIRRRYGVGGGQEKQDHS